MCFASLNWRANWVRPGVIIKNVSFYQLVLWACYPKSGDLHIQRQAHYYLFHGEGGTISKQSNFREITKQQAELNIKRPIMAFYHYVASPLGQQQARKVVTREYLNNRYPCNQQDALRGAVFDVMPRCLRNKALP